jgi:hypothetical protein
MPRRIESGLSAVQLANLFFDVDLNAATNLSQIFFGLSDLRPTLRDLPATLAELENRPLEV